MGMRLLLLVLLVSIASTSLGREVGDQCDPILYTCGCNETPPSISVATHAEQFVMNGTMHKAENCTPVIEIYKNCQAICLRINLEKQLANPVTERIVPNKSLLGHFYPKVIKHGPKHRNPNSPRRSERSPNDLESSPNDLESSPNDLESSPNDLESSPNDLESSPNDLESSPKDPESSSKDPESSSKDPESDPSPPCNTYQLENAAVSCDAWPHFRTCTIECTYGHAMEDLYGVVTNWTITCRDSENQWNPRNYTDCDPYVACGGARLIKPGVMTCYDVAEGPSYCDIECYDYESFDAIDKQSYECLDVDTYGPLLPHCAVIEKYPGKVVPNPFMDNEEIIDVNDQEIIDVNDQDIIDVNDQEIN